MPLLQRAGDLRRRRRRRMVPALRLTAPPS
uniref:Uncharacterized protein n=1 Tax=Zea mays TaxID=4577 RepID=C0HIM5_MAIZE|nr:unknown [Zea mays]